MHMIRIGSRKEQEKAIQTLLLDKPRGEYSAFPDFWVVSDEQAKDLEEAKVRFVYLSRTAKNDKTPSARPS